MTRAAKESKRICAHRLALEAQPIGIAIVVELDDAVDDVPVRLPALVPLSQCPRYF
jgi:hypothetical protein